MFQRKTKRRSVLLDMHGRIRALVDLAGNVDEESPGNYLDKMTLIDYLNLSKIVMGKLSKTSLIQLEFDRLMFDTAVQDDDIMDADQLFDLERNIAQQTDHYIRAVGNFSSFMSAEELWQRIKALNPTIIKITRNLILCVHSYSQTFYDSANDDSSAHRSDNPYIDALNDLNPDICLLSVLDRRHLVQAMSKMDSSELSRVNYISQTLLPKVTVDDSVNQGLWQRMTTKLGSSKKESNSIKAIVNIIGKYCDICEELHVDKHQRYVIQNLPPNPSILPLLERRIIEKYPDIKQYSIDERQIFQTRRMINSLIALTIAIVDSVAVLAAFRTMLLSKELDALRNEATNSLLDVPDKADLENFLNQIQPHNM